MIAILSLHLLLCLTLAQPECIPCESRETLLDITFSEAPHSWFANVANARWTSSAGVESKVTKDGLVSSSTPYVQWNAFGSPFFYDHEKGSTTMYEVFDEAKLYVEVEMKGETFGTESNPFPDNLTDENDLRLANCGIAMTLPNLYGINRYMILLTNDRVYAAAESAFVDTNGDSSGALLVSPVATRVPGQWHRLGMLLEQPGFLTNFQVSIDGSKLFHPFTQETLSFDYIINYSSIYEPADVIPVQLSFGHFAFFDAYRPCKEVGSCNTLPVQYGLVRTGSAITYPPFWDPIGTDQANHIWGQGSELTVRRLLVRKITSGCDNA